MLVMNLCEDGMGLVEREHGSTAGMGANAVSRMMCMPKRASDNVLDILGDLNDAQALPGSSTKMKLRQNALILR